VSGRTLALTAAAMLAFAANSLLCRAALGRSLIDPSSFTSVRLSTGALALVMLAGRRRGADTGSWLSAAALFAYALLFSIAYLRIPAAVGALVMFGAVQVTMIGWGFARGQRPVPLELLGAGVALLGLLGLTWPGWSAPDAPGCAVMAAAGTAWGAYSLRGLGAGAPLRVNASNFLRAIPFAASASALALAWGRPTLTLAGVGLAATSGAVTSGLGYALWYAALDGMSPTQAAVVQLSVPPLAALGGVLWLGEGLTARLLFSASVILGGIALAIRARRG
jgi:drug/metabolite transporter (DMT)-like permease